MNRQSGILIGILAGMAAGLMAIAAFRSGAGAMVMLFVAPVAVYLASLGWGTTAGIVAAVIASAAGMYSGGVAGAVITACLLFLPAAWIGHLANLGQPVNGGMIWFPLRGILMRLMIAVAAGIIVAGAVLGYDSVALEPQLVELLGELARLRNPTVTVDDALVARDAKLTILLLPFMVPAVWLAMHTASFYVSAGIARRSGRIARPRDDVPATANLPFEAVGIPLAGMVGMMVAPSPLYEIAAVLAGVGVAGFSMVGLAELHFVSRGKAGRGLLLFASYLLIVLFSLPALIFMVMGVMRAWRTRVSPPPPPNPTGT